MYSKLILGIAASVFLAFAGISAEDLLAGREEARPARATEAAELLEPRGPLVVEVAAAAEEAAIARDRATAMAVDAALDRLAAEVVTTSHSDALRYAFRAYFNYRAAHPEKVRKPYLYFVDYGLDSRTPRGYVFDMDALTRVAGPFAVAHGRGSEVDTKGLPTRFLNRDGSNATSLGLYLAQETYAFSGKTGGKRYRSVGLRLQGVSGRFNDEARKRGIVVHGAPYVTGGTAGRSEGCPAMSLELAQQLIPKIADGGMVFHFSALDTAWLREDPWAGVIVPRLAGVPQ